MKKTMLGMAALLAIGAGVSATEIVYTKADEMEYAGTHIVPTCKDGVFTLHGMVHFQPKKPIAIEAGKKYTFSVEVRSVSDKKLPSVRLAAVFSDEKDKTHTADQYMTIPDTLTTTVAAIDPADTTFTVKARPRIRKYTDFSTVIAFNAKEDESDLPNKQVSTRITNIEKDGENLKITVEKPLFAEIPAGTAVRMHRKYAFYTPVPAERWSNTLKPEWTTITGEVKVPAGAKNLRPIIVYYDESKPVRGDFEMRNLKVTIE